MPGFANACVVFKVTFVPGVIFATSANLPVPSKSHSAADHLSGVRWHFDDSRESNRLSYANLGTRSTIRVERDNRLNTFAFRRRWRHFYLPVNNLVGGTRRRGNTFLHPCTYVAECLMQG